MKPTRPMQLFSMSCCVAACLCAGALAQDHKQPTTPPAPKDMPKKGTDTMPKGKDGGAMDPKQAEEMAAWMAAATPNENHKMIEQMAGRWDMKVVTTMPDAPPSESKAEEHAMMTLGGRYLHGKVKGEMMGGMPFEGVSTMGYDNVTKKFVSTWIDSMSTGIMMETGSYDPATKTITMKGEFTDPTNNKQVKTRTTTKLIDTDHYTMTFFHMTADGKDNKVMEITAARTGKAEETEGYKKAYDDGAKKVKDAAPKGH